MTSIDNHSLRIIDPSFDKSNFRAEFKLPTDTVLLSNFRLINVGISSNQADSYSPTLGTQGAIRAIHLYDGAELLDSVRDFNSYSSWKNLNKTNDSNISANRHLNQVGLGFVQSGDATYTDPNLDQIGTLDTQNPVANNLTKQGWISLQNCLSFLRASVVVPTSLFRQLRVVVEFKDAEALKNAVRDRRDGTLSTDTGTALLCEEVDDGAVRAEMMRQYQGVVYHPYEFDSVVLPAVTTGAGSHSTKLVPAKTSNLIHGFNNKKLKRLLLIHKPTNSATWVNGNVNNGYGNNGSQALFDESTQIRINGVNKIAGNGVEGKNRRLAMTTDTFGDVNMFAGQQFVNLDDFNNNVAGANTLQKTQGSVDYLGMVIEEYINTLQVFIDRSGVHGNQSVNQAINLILMGEVEKAVVVGNNGYKIVYTQ
jgi:hypothetical protein